MSWRSVLAAWEQLVIAVETLWFQFQGSKDPRLLQQAIFRRGLSSDRPQATLQAAVEELVIQTETIQCARYGYVVQQGVKNSRCKHRRKYCTCKHNCVQ